MLPIDALEKPRVIVPPPALVQRFSEFSQSALDKCEQLIDENEKAKNEILRRENFIKELEG